MKGTRRVKVSKAGQQKLDAFYNAMRDGGLTLVAVLDGETVVVPADLIAGDWYFVREKNYLCALDADGNEVGPRYYGPIIGPPLH